MWKRYHIEAKEVPDADVGPPGIDGDKVWMQTPIDIDPDDLRSRLKALPWIVIRTRRPSSAIRPALLFWH